MHSHYQNHIIGQRHSKRDIRTLQIVYTKIDPYTVLKTHISNQIVYTARNIFAIVVWSVKTYTLCICPKVPFRVTLANYLYISYSIMTIKSSVPGQFNLYALLYIYYMRYIICPELLPHPNVIFFLCKWSQDTCIRLRRGVALRLNRIQAV